MNVTMNLLVTLLGTADASRIAMATSRVSRALKPRGTEIIQQQVAG